MTWVGLGIYAIGFVTMARYMILDVQDGLDSMNFEIRKENKARPKGTGKVKPVKWDALDVGLVFLVSFFWVLVAAFYAAKFLMFPRGLKSKFAREQERLTKAKEAEERAAKAEAEFRVMEEELLKFIPNETSAERLKRIDDLLRMEQGS